PRANVSFFFCFFFNCSNTAPTVLFVVFIQPKHHPKKCTTGTEKKADKHSPLVFTRCLHSLSSPGPGDWLLVGCRVADAPLEAAAESSSLSLSRTRFLIVLTGGWVADAPLEAAA
ncbi:unnamed protein product, partial [Ectocarpus fasciculatus]